MTNKPKAIGTAGETAVVRYLVANGFGSAERSALHGGEDQGDITGTPGVAWEVKAGHAAESASDAQVAEWMRELDIEQAHRGALAGVLVMKRKGKSAANAGQWWAVMPGNLFAWLVTGHGQRLNGWLPDVRMTLADAVRVLRIGGYGDPII